MGRVPASMRSSDGRKKEIYRISNELLCVARDALSPRFHLPVTTSHLGDLVIDGRGEDVHVIRREAHHYVASLRLGGIQGARPRATHVPRLHGPVEGGRGEEVRRVVREPATAARGLAR
jgi:hypothetical protein